MSSSAAAAAAAAASSSTRGTKRKNTPSSPSSPSSSKRARSNSETEEMREEARLLLEALFDEHDNQVTQSQLLELIEDHEDLREQLQDAVKTMDAAQRLEVLTAPENVKVVRAYRRLDDSEATLVRNMDSIQRVLYHNIKRAGNKGIWIRDLKRCVRGQPIPKINKALKTLLSRKAIKHVKSIAGKNRKVYMLFNLEPDVEVTGRFWYTQDQFNQKEFLTYQQLVIRFVHNSTELTLPQLQTQLNTVLNTSTRKNFPFEDLKVLVYGMLLEKIVYIAGQRAAVDVEEFSALEWKTLRIRLNRVFFLKADPTLLRPSLSVTAPCSVCPISYECKRGGRVSPTNCVYLKDWLNIEAPPSRPIEVPARALEIDASDPAPLDTRW